MICEVDYLYCCNCFLCGSVGKESACNARDTGDAGSVLGWGR